MTENHGVASSILALATKKHPHMRRVSWHHDSHSTALLATSADIAVRDLLNEVGDGASSLRLRTAQLVCAEAAGTPRCEEVE
jgi:hypothetical protein